AVEEATELLHEERYRDALVELRRVLKLDTKNPYAFYFLGIALFEVGELEAARDAYGACVKLAPSHLGARVALCHVLRTMGDLRGAIREGMAALSQAPGDSDALHAVGLAYHARGDAAAARKYLDAFLETNPEIEVAIETRELLGSLPGAGRAAGGEDD
ncbi:MAG: tetratricopeptide repeat protein, partial [Myxococcota bacterium]|nr:tetratricopeptide repeat protein [Myxococcota bacterium]